jgi:hypothetical protein
MAIQEEIPPEIISEETSFVKESTNGYAKQDEWDSSESSVESASQESLESSDNSVEEGSNVDPEKSELDDKARIAQLEAALAKSEQRNLETGIVTQYYEDKLQKLHRYQTYAVERMGMRIDLLEEELLQKTLQAETSKRELQRAVERIVLLQQEMANYQPRSTPPSPYGDILGVFKPRRRFATLPANDWKEEEKHSEEIDNEEEYEGHFEENHMRQEGEEKQEDKQEDKAVYVPRALHEGISSNETCNVEPRREGFQIARFFSFGQKLKKDPSLLTKSDLSSRPAVIKEFYEAAETPDVIAFDVSLQTAKEKSQQKQETTWFG